MTTPPHPINQLIDVMGPFSPSWNPPSRIASTMCIPLGETGGVGSHSPEVARFLEPLGSCYCSTASYHSLVNQEDFTGGGGGGSGWGPFSLAVTLLGLWKCSCHRRMPADWQKYGAIFQAWISKDPPDSLPLGRLSGSHCSPSFLLSGMEGKQRTVGYLGVLNTHRAIQVSSGGRSFC